MPIDTQALLDAAATIAEEENMKITIKHSAKGAVIGGAALFVGGMLLGPIGFLVGGTAGGAIAYYNSKGNFHKINLLWFC